MGISMSHKSTICLMANLGRNHDDKVITWMNELKNDITTQQVSLTITSIINISLSLYVSIFVD